MNSWLPTLSNKTVASRASMIQGEPRCVRLKHTVTAAPQVMGVERQGVFEFRALTIRYHLHSSPHLLIRPIFSVGTKVRCAHTPLRVDRSGADIPVDRPKPTIKASVLSLSWGMCLRFVLQIIFWNILCTIATSSLHNDILYELVSNLHPIPLRDTDNVDQPRADSWGDHNI